jgi:effector-binding domain-containing protein
MVNVETSVETSDRHQQQSIAIRSVVPMGSLDIGDMFDEYATRLASYTSEYGIEAAGAPYARYREFGPERADVEIGLPVDADLPHLEELEPDEVIGVSELPGGRVARVLHVGPYDQLGAVYQGIEAFMSEQGLKPADAPWESYLVLPDTAQGDPSRLRTEVCWPIA